MNYIQKRKDDAMTAAMFQAICALSVFPKDILIRLGLPSEVINQVVEVRNTEDDFIGNGLAFYGLCLTNFEMTEQDRIVATQMAGVLGACLANNLVMSKKILDSKDVLTSNTLWDQIWNFFEKQDGVAFYGQAAFFEESQRILEYVSQYNRDIASAASAVFSKGDIGNDETPDGIKVLQEKSSK